MLKKTCALVLSLALCITALSSAPDAQAAAKTKKIYLNKTKKTLKAGEKFTLKVKKVKPAKASKKVTWKSSKKSVATVSKKGVVKAKKAGKAKITAVSKKNKKVKASCQITVKPANSSSSATPSPTPKPNNSTATATATATAVPTGTATATPKVTKSPTPKPTATATPIPDDQAATMHMKDLVDYNVGTVVNYDKTQDEAFMKLAEEQFDIVSFENEMKGYSLIDREASVEAAKAAEAAGEDPDSVMPVCKFDQADEMVEIVKSHGLKIRGHVLIWEASMDECFFYKGYDLKEVKDEDGNVTAKNGELLQSNDKDKETLRKRMQSYVNTVVSHFEDKYPDTVIAWDVINEAIDPNAPVDPTTNLHLNNSGHFYQILGGEYIKYAFQYANDAVKKTGKDIALYYNDYNCFQAPKTTYLCDLIDYLNSDPDNMLLKNMGMEGYVLVDWPAANDIGKAMKKFADKGLRVGINELTVRFNPDYFQNKGGDISASDIQKHAKRCADVFTQYCKFNEENPGKLTNVSIWGLLDRPDLLAEKDKPKEERNYDYEIYGTNSGSMSFSLTS